MKSITFVACITSAVAAPLASWSPALGEFYAAVDKHIQLARQAGGSPPTCDLTRAVQPVAPTPLPGPDSAWKLSEVVVGRGIQNYTCSLASDDVKPKAIGAVASLYNVSCIAANYPDILAMIPGLALQYALPADPMANLEPSNLVLAGHHYFNADGKPTFDLSQDYPAGEVKIAGHLSQDLGKAVVKVNSNSTAPTDAPKGENGQGDGAVTWLLLDSIANITTAGANGDIQAVYRLNTAGGQPPATCKDSPAVFSVQYAAEYWFYTMPASAGAN